ncbi:11584_t:CDS:2, partial [Scutellospora calospora]
LYPIRLYFKTLVILKVCEFITEVVQSNSAFGPCPRYICKCDEIQSDICETATVAISSVYHQLFKIKTKFSGLEIVRIGSNEITTNLAGPGFKSAFIYQYNKSRALFFQEIDKNHCRVTIYYECNACINFIEQNPDLVWSKIGILQQYNGNQLFELTNQYTKNLIQAAQIPCCTLNEWNNKEIMTNIYNYHLKRHIMVNINWYQFFCNWLEQPNIIIELSCSDITSYKKDQSKFEFWSRSITLNSDRSSLSILYDIGFVTSAPLYSSMNAFWNSFHNSLEINKCGIDGCQRVLSIIANDFNYEVSNDLICAARKHAHIYGPGGLVTNKPVIRHKKMLSEKNVQLQSFLMDKANVIMSSYKTDPITNEPILHAINRYIRLDFDVTVGQDIKNVIKGIKRTFVANLNPIQNRGSGEWKIFTIAELDKFRKKDINKPTPQVSIHTTPSSE